VPICVLGLYDNLQKFVIVVSVFIHTPCTTTKFDLFDRGFGILRGGHERNTTQGAILRGKRGCCRPTVVEFLLDSLHGSFLLTQVRFQNVPLKKAFFACAPGKQNGRPERDDRANSKSG
jgi:hypothetical protein